ncbi:DUF4097 family beta strand repeat-containing protein [Paenibacillus sp. MB22_1]|uniref:DUF4097 family beta strand repeat-containing protein n=1 Tax=Paenibacillus TaxID=44249 RepID=UPI0001AFCE7F|nr:DUF4097 family beta strand repeat-containing protein [Paenibacillus sp. oral taxon 786]EES74678.1 hypothetical protein POTG_00958 [Paenibacillus sp. oral taxon 786 str. D14]
MNTKKWSLIGLLLILIGLAGMAYQHFEFGDELPSHQQKWTFDQGGLQTLLIDSDYDVELEFIDSLDGTNYVEINGNMNQKTIDAVKAAQISEGTLKLDLKDKFDWTFFSINFQSTKQRITVALGDKGELNRIGFKSDSSNGTFRGLRADDIDLSIDSGNIRVDQFEGTLTAKSSSGNITANQVKGTVKATSNSGDIRFNRFTGDGSFKSNSGNITLSEQRSDNLDISVGSGNATLSADAEFKGYYDLQSGSGNTTAPDSPRQTQDLIKVRANSGNIRIR